MKTIKIGRGPENDHIISNSHISREHAQITYTWSGEFLLKDLSSSNGSFVNGEQITGTVNIRPGDKIQFANEDFDWEPYFREFLRPSRTKGDNIQRDPGDTDPEDQNRPTFRKDDEQ